MNIQLAQSIAFSKKFKPSFLLAKDSQNNLWLFKTKYQYSDLGYTYSLTPINSSHKHATLQNITKESFSFLKTKFLALQFLEKHIISKNDLDEYTTQFSSEASSISQSSDFLKSVLPLSFDLFNNLRVDDQKKPDDILISEDTKKDKKTKPNSQQSTLF